MLTFSMNLEYLIPVTSVRYLDIKASFVMAPDPYLSKTGKPDIFINLHKRNGTIKLKDDSGLYQDILIYSENLHKTNKLYIINSNKFLMVTYTSIIYDESISYFKVYETLKNIWKAQKFSFIEDFNPIGSFYLRDGSTVKYSFVFRFSDLLQLEMYFS